MKLGSRAARPMAVLTLVASLAIALPAGAQEPAVEAPSAVPGFFRIDTDSYGLQLWVGATHTLGPVEIYSDVFLNGALGEVDVGPQLRLGNLTLILTAGPVFDFASQDVVALVAPFLTTIYDHPKIYIESWLVFTFGSPFADGAEDLFHTRNFALYKLNETLWLGPQVELDYGLREAEDVTSLPIGGQISAGYGKDNRLSLFLGYETQEQVDPVSGDPADSDRLAGRVTFVRLW